MKIDAFTEYIGKCTSWLIIILVFLVGYDVSMRYLFQSGSIGIQELEWHLFSIILLINYLMLLAFSASGISNIYQVFLSAPLVLLYSTQIASLVIVILGFIYRIKFMKHIKFY